MRGEAITIIFLLLIAYPFMPLNGLQGQFWTRLSAAAWDTDSSHGQMLAPVNQGYWTVIRWLNGGRAPRALRGLGLGSDAGLLWEGMGGAGGRAMSPKVKLNYLGVDLLHWSQWVSVEGKQSTWPPRVGAKASCKQLPQCRPGK